MAISGIRFTIDADNTKAIAGIRQVMNIAKDAGREIQNAFGQKLKQTLSITAIEEGVRRTAEWAAQIDKTSKALDISRESLQALQKIGSRAGVGEDTITSMFENINKARKEAINGNQEMIRSFARLGVTFQDLRSMKPTELFSKTMEKMDVTSNDSFVKKAIEDVAGTSPSIIGSIQNQMGGKSFVDTSKQMVEEGETRPEGEVSSIAQMWNNTIEDLKELGLSMAPIVEIILGIFRMLVNTLGAVFDVINSLGSILMGIVTLDGDKIKKAFMDLFGLFANLGYGLGKFVTGMIELIPGVKKLGMTKWIQGVQDEANAGAGISKRIVKHGEGAGEMVGTLAGGELLGAVGRTGVGNAAINKITNKMGIRANAYKAGEQRWQRISSGDQQRLNPELLKNEMKIMKKADKEMGIKNADYSEMEDQIAYYSKKMGNETEFEVGGVSAKPTNFQRSIIKNMKTLNMLSSAGPMAALNVGAGVMEAQKARKSAYSINEKVPGSTIYSGGLSGMGDIGGSTNLKIGGMFGQSTNKLIKLNVDMVTLLGVIKDNTSIFAKNNQLLAGGSNNFGGVSGGL